MELAKQSHKTNIGMFFGIAIPVALQNLLAFAVSLMDSIMVGALGEAELSAVTAANQIYFLLSLAVFGLGSGAGVLLSQYWGKKDYETLTKVLGLTVRISVIMGLICFGFSAAIPTQLLTLFTNESEVIALGSEYLRVACISYVFFAFSASYLHSVRNVERVAVAVITNTISFFVNVFFNYIFIFGKFGAPALGVTGAAIGTIIARITETVIVLVYAYKIDKRIRFTLKSLFVKDTRVAKGFIHYAVPVVVNEMMWGLGTTVITAVIGRMGVSAMASVSVVTNVVQIMQVLMLGAGSATLVIVGKSIGEEQYSKTRKEAGRLVLYNVIIAAVCAGLLLLLRPAFISLYSFTDAFTNATKLTINSTLISAAIIMLPSSISLSCIVGVFRGGGDTVFAMWLDLITLWGFAVPLGAAAGLIWHLSVPITFFILRSDEVVKAVICLFRLKSGKWLRNVTKSYPEAAENYF